MGVKGEGRFKLSWTGLKNWEELKRGIIRGSRRRGGGGGSKKRYIISYPYIFSPYFVILSPRVT